MKKSYKNNKFKISASTWNEGFVLPDGSYSVSHIQDYFKYILNKHGPKTCNSSIRTSLDKIENRTTFRMKTGYYLELLAPETMELFGSNKSKVTKDKNGKNVLHLEITEILLAHCHILNNDYQQDLRFSYTFVPNKLFCQLFDFRPNCLDFIN